MDTDFRCRDLDCFDDSSSQFRIGNKSDAVMAGDLAARIAERSDCEVMVDCVCGDDNIADIDPAVQRSGNAGMRNCIFPADPSI